MHHQGPETIQVGADHFRLTSVTLWAAVVAVLQYGHLSKMQLGQLTNQVCNTASSNEKRF